MALSDSEIYRIRKELGYNVLTVGAEPYIGIVAIFNRVIQTYMSGGASTTSSTAVTAASTPTVVGLVLASITGFTTGDRVVVDVDSFRETPTIRSISGSTISVALSLAHTGTYPVVVEGGETMVRDLLRKIEAVNTQLDAASSTAGLKRAEDIEWYQSQTGAYGGSAQLGALYSQRSQLRDELAMLLGVENLWRVRQSAGSSVAVY